MQTCMSPDCKKSIGLQAMSASNICQVAVTSFCCASLSQADGRDAETWSIHLPGLVEQDFPTEVNSSDHGSGMVCVFKEILPESKHCLSHLHIIKACKELAGN